MPSSAFTWPPSWSGSAGRNPSRPHGSSGTPRCVSRQWSSSPDGSRPTPSTRWSALKSSPFRACPRRERARRSGGSSPRRLACRQWSHCASSCRDFSVTAWTARTAAPTGERWALTERPRVDGAGPVSMPVSWWCSWRATPRRPHCEKNSLRTRNKSAGWCGSGSPWQPVRWRCPGGTSLRSTGSFSPSLTFQPSAFLPSSCM